MKEKGGPRFLVLRAQEAAFGDLTALDLQLACVFLVSAILLIFVSLFSTLFYLCHCSFYS